MRFYFMLMSSSVPAEARKQRFIALAKSVHGDKYSYDNVVYTNNRSNVLVTCKVHGDFLVRPSHHTSSKSGCVACYNESKRKGLAFYLKAAKDIHGETYDYSKVSLTLCTDIVEIICKEHGSFYQGMEYHIHHKSGCPKCAIALSGKMQSHGKEEWLAKFKAKHGDEFTYPQDFETTNQYCYIDITCKMHGVFRQTLTAHYCGSKCPECQKSLSTGFKCRAGTEDDPSNIYLVSFVYESKLVYKVGATKDLHRRLRELYYAVSVEPTLLLTYEATMEKCLKVELSVKKEYRRSRCVFDKNFVGYTECYSLNDSQVSQLKDKISAYFN